MKTRRHFNNVVSQLLSIDIKILDHNKCVSLLCSQPSSWDSEAFAIGNNTTTFMYRFKAYIG